MASETVEDEKNYSSDDDIEILDEISAPSFPPQSIHKNNLSNGSSGFESGDENVISNAGNHFMSSPAFQESSKTNCVISPIQKNEDSFLDTSHGVFAGVHVDSLKDEDVDDDDTPCGECGQKLDSVISYTLGDGLSESEAVRDQNMSIISWGESLNSDIAPCFKVINVSVFDSIAHLVSITKGLIEEGKDLYFSGTLINIMNDDHSLAVDRIGPLISWSKPHGWNSTLIVLTTCLEGKIIEYHLDSNDFSNVYQDALKKTENKMEDLLENINKSTPIIKPKLLGPKSKRKSEVSPSDEDNSPNTRAKSKRKSVSQDSDEGYSPPKKLKHANNSSDEEYSPESNKKTTTAKSRKRVHLARNTNDGNKQKYDSKDTKEIPHFEKQMAKIPKILKSFDKNPGFGDLLTELLPTEHQKSRDAIAAFILFVLERQKAWSNKRRRRKKLTSNQVLSNKWFTNMYRELDRGTMFFRNCLNKTDLKGVAINKDVIDENLVKKVLFKSIVYRLINKVETFMNFGSATGMSMIPGENEFPQFLEYLHEKKSEKVVLFTAAHQNMGFDRLMTTFEYLQQNINTLSSNVVVAAKKRSTKACQDALLKIPNVGAFFAWQINCDLLESQILGPNTDNQWVMLGPGAQNGLRRIFRLVTTKGELKHTRLLRDICSLNGRKSGFAALGLEFPAFLHKPLSLKNIEHALCEFDKYFRLALGVPFKDREYSEQKSRSHLDSKSQCGLCSKDAKEECVKCLFCGILYHKSCETDWGQKYHQDGSWLCDVCHEIEKAWSQEDFSYEEVDPNDNVGRAFVTGEEKAEMVRKWKNGKKGRGKGKSKKKIECIELSSDDDEEEDDDDRSLGDDEVEFLEAVEVQRHFFGVDFNDSSSSNNIINDDSSDPLAEIPDKSSVVSPSLEESSIKKPIEEDDDAGVFILS